MAGLRKACPELAQILEFSTDSIFYKLYDEEIKEFVFYLVSKKKASNSGVCYEDMIGKSDFDFLSKEEAQRCHDDEMYIKSTGENIPDKEEQLTNGDGTKRWVSVSKFPWRDVETGEIIGIIGIARDITKQKKMESNILQMLCIATHDIRSPIVSMALTIKLLLKGRFGDIGQSVEQTLSEVLNRMFKLEEIVKNYLAKSSVMAADSIGKKELIDLRIDVIDPLLDEFSKDILEKNIQIDNKLGGIPGNAILVNANTFVEASKNKLEIVCRNLLDNAIKYTPYGGRIAFGFEDCGNEWRINFFSSSEAMSPEKLELIFKMFESESSSGIGLSFCRRIIELHGGRIWCEATPDGHTNFIFTLPKSVKE